MEVLCCVYELEIFAWHLGFLHLDLGARALLVLAGQFYAVGRRIEEYYTT